MEPKVIQQTLQLSQLAGDVWGYDPEHHFCRQSGSANNWAFGYFKHGPACKEGVLDVVRKEVERADSLSGFALVHSLAGGTGSGFGTHTTEALRDQYGQTATMVNCVVWTLKQ